ncbi:MAG: PEP-CTERM sorting domain-containing protein [Tepidisphaeraceae bacterium]
MTNQGTERKGIRKGVLVGAALALALGTAAEAAQLVDFKPDPISPGLPEIQLLNTGALVAAPTAGGSMGNSDGKAAADGNPNAQTPGGLLVQTPVAISTVGVGNTPVDHYGGVVNTGSDGNSTSFYDVTLVLSNINTNNPAQTVPLIPAYNINAVTQDFTTGTFTLYSTHLDDAVHADPNDHSDQVVLLTGTIANMILIGIEGQGTASIQSTYVTYTGGEILTPWKLANGYAASDTVTGDLSWSLLSVSPGVAIDNNTNLMQQFQADMTGLFSAPQVPEPASVALLALSGVGLLGRFRKHKARVR